MPFELGRPFGAPDNPAFQRRVLMAALELLEAKSGPLIEDFDHDAPPAAVGDDGEGWACPVVLPRPDEDENLLQSWLAEIGRLKPWYDESVAHRGRTTVGASGLDIEGIARFVNGFLGDARPDNPRTDMSLGETLKHACEDMRAFYFESVAAQPGRTRATSEQITDWFWNETTGGTVFRKLDPVCAASDDEMMQHMANYLLIPRAQTGSVGDGVDGRVNPEFVAN